MRYGKLSRSARIAAINRSSVCRSIRRGIAGCMGLDSSTRARGRSAMETQVKAKEASSAGNLRANNTTLCGGGRADFRCESTRMQGRKSPHSTEQSNSGVRKLWRCRDESWRRRQSSQGQWPAAERRMTRRPSFQARLRSARSARTSGRNQVRR
jgi:hypothetical protein